MRDVRQLPASMTSVVDAPRAVSSDASPTRPLCAVKRASIPAARAAAVICPNIEQLRIERGRDERIRLGDERGRGRDRDSGPEL